MLYDRLIHHLLVVRTPRDPLNEDDYGQPELETAVETPVTGLIQPKTAREVLAASEAGADVGDYTIFLPLNTDLIGADFIRYAGDTTRRYEVRGIRPFNFGNLAHLEVDARMVQGSNEEVGS
jgi:hypothetical protein